MFFKKLARETWGFKYGAVKIRVDHIGEMELHKGQFSKSKDYIQVKIKCGNKVFTSLGYATQPWEKAIRQALQGFSHLKRDSSDYGALLEKVRSSDTKIQFE